MGSDPKREVRATPLVRKVAQELGVDLARVDGSGPEGRITEDDVRRTAPLRDLSGRDGGSPCAASAG